VNDSETLALIEKREQAIKRLKEAIAACKQAELTHDEVLGLFRSDGDQNVILDGSLIDFLDDDDATVLLRMAYRALDDGAAFVFTSVAEKSARREPIYVRRPIVRTEQEIRALCAAAGIGGTNVTVTREARSLRVAVEKLQS
jgi:hypothetical protein